MAAAWFNAIADVQKARAISAGTQPAAQVHPEVVAAMREIGIDLMHARPALLTFELGHTAQMLVTMGCGEECPVVPGVERVDWEIDDPKNQPASRVREIRDEVRRRVTALVGSRGWAREFTS